MSLFSRFVPVLLCLIVSVSLVSQQRTLGTWRSFMPYGNSVGVYDAGDKIYCGASQSVFSYEKSTGVIQTYDKATGLNDVGIKTIAYDAATDALVIAYLNSNIDLLYHGTDVYNISDIKDKSTTSSVSIYDIYFHNGTAYISSDMGISMIDLSKKEISNSYIIGSSGNQIRVYATTVDGTYIYAATQEGVKRAPISSPNLQNFNSWILFNSSSRLPTIPFSHVQSYNNKVYASSIGPGIVSDTLYEFSGSQWQPVYYEGNDSIISLQALNGNLYFAAWNDSTLRLGAFLGKLDALGNLTTRPTVNHIRPYNWFESNNVSWEADIWQGLFKNTPGNIENIIPEGPGSSAVFDIEAKNDVLKIAPGGADDSWLNTWNSDGLFIYENNRWIKRNQYTDGGMTDYYDILAVATPASNKTYFASFLSGLIEMNNQTGHLTFYDQYNQPFLEGANGDPGRTKISALCADNNGNLWIGNAYADKPIKVITPDGTWLEFSVPFPFDLMKKIIVDQYGQLWAPLRGAANTGILVWSHNGTLSDSTDDQSRVLKAGEGRGGLPDPVVYSLAEDREGNIWVGTGQGIAVYYCPGSVLSSSGCDADQIKVERDGYIGYLFGTEIVRAIAVDAANRKWIGTGNGLWLVSADGKEELLKFNTENSPLPNNQITDIAIDETTGEVFIGTIGGLVSYQGDAVKECGDCDEALVYPNPVRPDYTGPIAIKGLTDQAYVKITDVAGTLIYQGKANGSQMIWDGKGYNGDRARSGVYLVFSSTELGKEKRVGKILVLN